MAAAEILPSAHGWLQHTLHGTLGKPHLHQVAGGDEGEADHHPVEVVEGRLRQLGKGVHPHLTIVVLSFYTLTILL